VGGRGGSWLGRLGWLATESLRGFRRSRRVALAATLSIGLSCSVLFVFLYAWQAFGSWAASQRQAHGWTEVYLRDGTDPQVPLARAKALAGVDSVRFVSALEARDEFAREFGPEMLDALEDNPLPASLRVHASVPFGAQLTGIVHSLQAFPEAEEVRSPQGSLDQVERLETWARRLAVGTAALLALVLLGIVHNSISLSLGARGALIDNMRLCGAEPWHMEIPFAAEGLIQGALGGLVATVLPWCGLWGMARFFPLPLPLEPGWALRSGHWVVAFASILGASSGWWTIRRSVR
jgi:cell division transport system permease protein